MDERIDDRPDHAVLELYGTLRNEVKHEDDLIGQRVNWFTASQAFLLVSLAIAHRGETHMPTPGNNTLFPLVPIVALSSSVLIFFGVIAGIAALLQKYPTISVRLVGHADSRGSPAYNLSLSQRRG